MSDTIPSREPTRLTAGDSWRWDRSFSAYPPGTWTLTYTLLGETKLSIVAGDGGDGVTHEARATPAQTANVAAGAYSLVGHVTDGTDRFEVYRGAVEVMPNPTTATPAESHASKTLTLIEAAIEGRIPQGLESYQIDGVAVSKMPMEQLVKLRGQYAALVRQERKGTAFGSVGVRFRDPA